MPITKQEAREWARTQTSQVVCVDDLANAYTQGYLACERRVRQRNEIKFPSNEQLTEMRELYTVGRLSAKELAQKYDVKTEQVQYLLRRNKISKNFTWKKKDKQYLLRHYGKDKTLQELTDHFNIGKHAIQAAYHKFKTKEPEQ